MIDYSSRKFRQFKNCSEFVVVEDSSVFNKLIHKYLNNIQYYYRHLGYKTQLVYPKTASIIQVLKEKGINYTEIYIY